MKKMVVCSMALLLSACQAIQPNSQAQKVIVSPNAAPKECKFKGQVVGNQGNFFTGGFTSNSHLEEGAINDMKNKASQLDANYVQLITNRAGITGSMSGSSSYGNGYTQGHSEQTNVTDLGNAYACPPKLIGLE